MFRIDNYRRATRGAGTISDGMVLVKPMEEHELGLAGRYPNIATEIVK